MNAHGLYATDFCDVRVGAGDYELIAVRADSGMENTVWISDSGERRIDTEGAEGERTISFIAGRYYGQDDSAATIRLFLSDGTTERELFATELENSSIDRYEVPASIGEEDTLLVLRVYTALGELFSEKEADKVFIMNLRID